MYRFVFLRFFVAAVLVNAPFVAPVAANPAGDDNEALAALYESYRQAWLLNDERTEEAVLSLFAEGASIIPSGGANVFSGHDAMRGFWFPPDSPPGTVDLFEQEPLKISVGHDHGFVLGRFKLRFSYPGESYYTEGYNLFSAVKEEGVWKISTMMWTHPAWQVEKTGAEE